MTSTEIIVIVVGLLVGYWVISRVIGAKPTRDGTMSAGSESYKSERSRGGL